MKSLMITQKNSYSRIF